MAKSVQRVIEVVADDCGELQIHGLAYRIARRELRELLRGKGEPSFELVDRVARAALAKAAAASEARIVRVRAYTVA